MIAFFSLDTIAIVYLGEINGVSSWPFLAHHAVAILGFNIVNVVLKNQGKSILLFRLTKDRAELIN